MIHKPLLAHLNKTFFCIVTLTGILLQSATASSSEARLTEINELKILTWNVLYHTDIFVDDIKKLLYGTPLPSERIAPILALIREQNADVIALQEVRTAFYDALLQQNGFRDYHKYTTLPSPSGSSFKRRIVKLFEYVFGGGTDHSLIMSKWPIKWGKNNHLPSRQGREMLSVNIWINGQPIMVATTHLESGSRSIQTRIKQLDTIFWNNPKNSRPCTYNEHKTSFSRTDNAILLGDLNFSDNSAEEQCIPDEFHDIWYRLHPELPGHTFGKETNKPFDEFARARAGGSRLDRILIKSQDWVAEEIEIIGNHKVSINGQVIYPSDHFGLVATLHRK